MDSFEGPMPQTRFVLKKALELNLKVIIVINKMDRPDARCAEVVDETLELLLELDATDEQLDSPDGVRLRPHRHRHAWTGRQPGTDLKPLFDMHPQRISPRPRATRKRRLQLLVSTIDYNDYVGRIGVGRIERGTVSGRPDGHSLRVRIESFVSAPTRLGGLYEFDGLKRVNCESSQGGRYRGRFRL